MAYLLPKWLPPPPELPLAWPPPLFEELWPPKLREELDGAEERVEGALCERIEGADERPALLLPNERLLVPCGLKVRLGVELLLPRRLPKVRLLLFGCVTVVRVLLWRGEP